VYQLRFISFQSPDELQTHWAYLISFIVSSNPELGEYKEAWMPVLRFFMFLSAISPGVHLSIRPYT